ncbi:MAG: hypothetical protein HY858_02075 [Candidatus Solibacter usitatus]|nr:hypothetical protein [Candidatus Solibacter usitatus]
MQRITFSADPELIERARARARQHNTTLNVLFREWLREVASEPDLAAEFRDLMDRTSYVDAGRRFTRTEMNQR